MKGSQESPFWVWRCPPDSLTPSKGGGEPDAFLLPGAGGSAPVLCSCPGGAPARALRPPTLLAPPSPPSYLRVDVLPCSHCSQRDRPTGVSCGNRGAQQVSELRHRD